MAGGVREARRSTAQPRNPSRAPAKSAAKRGPTGGRAPARSAAPNRGGLAPATIASLVGVVVVLGAIAFVATNSRVHHFVGKITADIDAQLTAQGLRVESLRIHGATPDAQTDIARASGLYLDQPILDVDLKALRARIEQVGWVKSARVVRLLPNVIEIDIAQRPTFAVWEHAGHAMVIDNTGRTIPEADPGRFASLPIVVGEGADQAAPAILPVVRAHPMVMGRLDALVRVDDRRWDLRMKDGSVIQLPVSGEDAALIQLDQLDQKSRILTLGFERIDLRDPELVAVRPREVAAPGQLVANGA